jgi:transposase
MGRYVGVDLHKRSFQVCYWDRGKSEQREFLVSKEGIEGFVKSLKKTDRVGIEATGNARYLAGEIGKSVKEVKLINPWQFKVISRSVKKTDEHDAETIAKYLSKGLIPEVRMRSKEQQQVSSLITTRDKLVKLRSTLKNKIHGILNANGYVTKREIFGSEKGLERIFELGLDDAYQFELRVIVDQIKSLTDSIDKITRELTERGKKMKGFENLKSISGIGDVSATIMLSVIGNVEDFEDADKMAAYLGIVPRVHNSSDTVRHGRITKMGNKIGRTALVQSTLIAIKYNNYLRQFYERLKARKGSGKAIIATARKLLAIIYRALKYDLKFADFGQYKLATSI